MNNRDTDLTDPDLSRGNAINAINAAASGIGKQMVSVGDIAVSHAAAQIATAAALVYLGDCVREIAIHGK